jgi:hypothetical protein
MTCSRSLYRVAVKDTGLTQLALGVVCVRCEKFPNLYEIIGPDAPYS